MTCFALLFSFFSPACHIMPTFNPWMCTHHIRSYPPWTLNNIFSHFIHLFPSCFFLSPSCLSLSAPFQLFAREFAFISSAWMMCVCSMRVEWKTRRRSEYYFGECVCLRGWKLHTFSPYARGKTETWDLKKKWEREILLPFSTSLTLHFHCEAHHTERLLPFQLNLMVLTSIREVKWWRLEEEKGWFLVSRRFKRRFSLSLASLFLGWLKIFEAESCWMGWNEGVELCTVFFLEHIIRR